jgi:hypothetical protein
VVAGVSGPNHGNATGDWGPGKEKQSVRDAYDAKENGGKK